MATELGEVLVPEEVLHTTNITALAFNRSPKVVGKILNLLELISCKPYYIQYLNLVGQANIYKFLLFPDIYLAVSVVVFKCLVNHSL